MGLTNRLRPKDVTTIGKTTADPEDLPDALGLADIDHFAEFVRGTKVPPRDAALAESADAVAGQALFEGLAATPVTSNPSRRRPRARSSTVALSPCPTHSGT